MNRRHARAIREGVIIARKDYLFLEIFFTDRPMRNWALDWMLRTGGPSSAIGGNAYAVALTRLTRKARL